jgi:hypothetical protein
VLNQDNSFVGAYYAHSPKVAFEDREGKIWIGGFMDRMVEMYDQGSGQWALFGETKRKDYPLSYYDDAVLPLDVKRICQSKDGRLWFSTDHTERGQWATETPITSFDGKHWLARQIEIDPKNWPAIGLIQGRDGRVWFFNQDELSCYDGNRWSSLRLSEVIKDAPPEIPPQVVGTDQEALALYRYRIRYHIYAGIEDRTAHIWLSTGSGVVRFDERSEWKKYPQLRRYSAHPMYADRQGRIWLVNWNHVVLFDPVKATVAPYNVADHVPPDRDDDIGLYANPTVNAIYQDKRGHILFAVGPGLLCFTEQSDKWEYFDLKAVMGYRYVLPAPESFMEDNRGQIWITTSIGILVLGE